VAGPAVDAQLTATLDLTARLVAAGLLVWGIETWSRRASFAHGGWFSLAAVEPPDGTRALRAVDRTLRPLLAVEVAGAAGVLAVGVWTVPGRVALVALAAGYGAARWRRRLGGDGGEQMSALVLLALLLAVLPAPSTTRAWAAVVLVAAQAALAYLTAGVAKVASPAWRTGTALPGILATYTHGDARTAGLLTRIPLLGLAGGWAVVLYECTFVVLVLGPRDVALAVLAVGLVFHLACAVLMGLSGFVWAFTATYPCVLLAGDAVRSVISVGQ